MLNKCVYGCTQNINQQCSSVVQEIIHKTGFFSCNTLKIGVLSFKSDNVRGGSLEDGTAAICTV